METRKHTSEADVLRGALTFASRVIRRMAAGQTVNTSVALWILAGVERDAREFRDRRGTHIRLVL
jgi:hypothetical protein